MDKKAFGKRVRVARQRVRLSTDRLSELCDCSPVSIRQIESGVRLPSLPKLLSLCNALRISPNDLLAPELSFPIEEKVKSELDEREEYISHLTTRLRRSSEEKSRIVCNIAETLLDQLGRL